VLSLLTIPRPEDGVLQRRVFPQWSWTDRSTIAAFISHSRDLSQSRSITVERRCICGDGYATSESCSGPPRQFQNWGVLPDVEGVALGRLGPPPVIVGGMQIIVDISEGEDGRPVGTIRAAGERGVRSFSGNLEFLRSGREPLSVNADEAGEGAGSNDKGEL